MDISSIANRIAADYIHDPSHKKHPGGNYHQTPKGWSSHENKDHVSGTSDMSFKKMAPAAKAAVILAHDKTISDAASARKKFSEKYGKHWFKIIKGKEKEEWDNVRLNMANSIRWARENIGGERWWNLPSVIKAREKVRDEISTDTIDTPGRNKLRASIADKLYGNGSLKKEKKMFVVMGLPGSGKSKVIVNRIKQTTDVIEVDADGAKELLPEFKGGEGAGIVHKESANIVEYDVLTKCVQEGDNIVFPTVGKNEEKLKKLLSEWKKQGYKIHLSLVGINLDSSIERALIRWVQTGRFVDPEYIKTVGTNPIKTFHNLKGMADSYEYWDNEVPKGSEPKLIERNAAFRFNETERRNFIKMIDKSAVKDLDESRILGFFEHVEGFKKKTGKKKLTDAEIHKLSADFKKQVK